MGRCGQAPLCARRDLPARDPSGHLASLLCGHHWDSGWKDRGQLSVLEGGHSINAFLRSEGTPWPRDGPLGVCPRECSSHGHVWHLCVSGTEPGPRAHLPCSWKATHLSGWKLHTPCVSRVGAGGLRGLVLFCLTCSWTLEACTLTPASARVMWNWAFCRKAGPQALAGGRCGEPPTGVPCEPELGRACRPEGRVGVRPIGSWCCFGVLSWVDPRVAVPSAPPGDIPQSRCST